MIRRIRWQLMGAVSPRRILVRTPFGGSMILSHSDGSGPQIFMGEYESDESRIIRETVTPGMVALDVGANIGYFTLLMAQNVGSTGKIHAFEPNPVMLHRLEQNIALNPGVRDGRISVHPYALGSLDGEAEFFCPVEGFEGAGGLQNTNRAPVLSVKTVPVRTLDTAVREERIGAIGFIKMDIEGGEFGVLKKGLHTLSQMQPTILFEAYEGNTAPYGYRVFEILAFLEAAGFCVRQAGMSYNFIAVPKAGKPA
ncbi:MAG TPA: FkbM family methyltransferase [Bacteroidota bacterium]